MSDPARVRVTGPLECCAGGFMVELLEAGYRPRSAAIQLRLLAHLSRWLEEAGVDPAELGEPLLERFHREHLDRVAGLRDAGMARLLGHLRAQGVIPLPAAPPARSSAERLLDRYREYLLVERGLTADTARGYVDLVRPFVASRVRDGGGLELAGMTPAEVLDFVLGQARLRPRRSVKMLVTALRSLLVFLHVDGLIERSLAQVVPSVAFWRLQGLPRGLGADQVTALLDSCDVDTVAGRLLSDNRFDHARGARRRSA
jgi:integrase/recombinase XerD